MIHAGIHGRVFSDMKSSLFGGMARVDSHMLFRVPGNGRKGVGVVRGLFVESTCMEDAAWSVRSLWKHVLCHRGQARKKNGRMTRPCKSLSFCINVP